MFDIIRDYSVSLVNCLHTHTNVQHPLQPNLIQFKHSDTSLILVRFQIELLFSANYTSCTNFGKLVQTVKHSKT